MFLQTEKYENRLNDSLKWKKDQIIMFFLKTRGSSIDNRISIKQITASPVTITTIMNKQRLVYFLLCMCVIVHTMFNNVVFKVTKSKASIYKTTQIAMINLVYRLGL